VWDNARLLNSAAGVLVGVAMLGLGVAGAQLFLRSELFPVLGVEVRNRPEHTSSEEIQAALSGRIARNFFAVDLAEVRATLEALPWVRRVEVRRVWPDRLELALEEHSALARWSDEGLVNTHGERFFASSDADLPIFVGPPGSEREMARRYVRFAALLEPLGAAPERVVLSARLAWQLRLDNGLNLLLGRDADAAERRLARFVEAYAETLGRIARRHQYVDLRYPNGFAVRIPELGG
jgi:cell division protein FtsQ